MNRRYSRQIRFSNTPRSARLAASYCIEIRGGQAQMRGQCTDDLDDVGQLLRPVF